MHSHTITIPHTSYYSSLFRMDIYHATPPVPLPADTQKINEIVQLNKDRASIIFLRDQQKEEHIIYIVQRRSI